MDEIGDYMSSPVLRIDADASVREAAEFMEANAVGSLLVEHHGEDVGVVTERDLTSKVIAAGKSPDDCEVSDIMTKPILSMDRYLPIEEANEFMVKNKIRHLAVTEDEKIVGIISVRDLVAFFSKSFRMQE